MQPLPADEKHHLDNGPVSLVLEQAVQGLEEAEKLDPLFHRMVGLPRPTLALGMDSLAALEGFSPFRLGRRPVPTLSLAVIWWETNQKVAVKASAVV